MDFVWRRNKPLKFTVIKKVRVLNFELLPNIQNNLDWYENFTTITRLHGEHNPISFNWKQTLDEGDTSLQSCSHQMEFGTLKLNLWTSIGFPKTSTFWIDLKILPHKLEERAQILQQVLLNLDIGCKSYSTLIWT